MKFNRQYLLLAAAAAVAACTVFSSGTALLLGIFIGLTTGNPAASLIRSWTSRLLAASIVGLGAGMDLSVVARVGAQGIGYTCVTIAATMALGWWFGRLFNCSRPLTILISTGTAICGGSAIAAAAGAIHAEGEDVSVALATVFLLNAVALLLFPPIGHLVQLDQGAFGLWAALAIHDTSSVVGATLAYGADALRVGTTVKLARALWIVPVTLVLSRLQHHETQDTATRAKAKRPWFILGFLAAAALVTWLPQLQPAGQVVELTARRALVGTLFLIGTTMTRDTLLRVGARPLLLGVSLWVVVGVGTLLAVLADWIH